MVSIGGRSTRLKPQRFLTPMAIRCRAVGVISSTQFRGRELAFNMPIACFLYKRVQALGSVRAARLALCAVLALVMGTTSSLDART